MDTTLMETDANDVMEMSVLEHWRSTWTDLSRTEEVTAQGPSFVLWHSDTNGFESPGFFFSADAIDQLIPTDELREAVRARIDEIDHARAMAVVLVFKEE
ncbi:hypothetical protein, partial [Pseudomonas aeruginosa]